MYNRIWIAMAVRQSPGEPGKPPKEEILHQPQAILARDEVRAQVKAALKFQIDPDDPTVELCVVPFG
jgi:hypothetical protein